ncbi:hypothetical protein AcV7_006385 [Taiwanofungus camphoratus]|nr:hypothetical protein AcV7_006385 [Antrodia cinnamomea]
MTIASLVMQWALILVTTLSLWLYFRRRLVNSTLNNLPGPPCQSFWKGNLDQFFNRHASEFHKEVTQNYGAVVKMQGIFGKPMLYVYDPKALHTIVVKQQDIFEKAESTVRLVTLLFGPGVLATLGETHRAQRKMLNPAFSINHMRDMLPIFYNIVHKLRDAIATRVSDGPQEVDMLGWMGRTALELIGQGGLGYSFDPLVEDKADAYGEAIKAIIPALITIHVFRELLPYVGWIGPAWFRRRVVEVFPNKQVQKLKSIVDTMATRSVEIFEAKKAALDQGDEVLAQQVGEGKDIMSLLIRANRASSLEDKLPEDQLIAQMSSLIFAGMDTTSNALSRTLHILAQRPDVQERLRDEIIEAGHGDNISYDELVSLPYLDAVCRETLRLDPTAPLPTRQPNKDVVLPLSEPIRGIDGKMMSEILVPKGTMVIPGVLGSNINKTLWGEDALEWKPERWLSPLPSAVTDAPIPGVYSHLMTFFGGSRSCIGFKFSQLEMKVVLSVLLSNFTFELTEKPIEWNVATVRYPTVGKESNVSQMPLKVGLLKRVRD